MKITQTLSRIIGVSALAFLAGPALAATCEVSIEGNDAMMYNLKEITLGKSCPEYKITLTNVGKQPKNAMGHNLVVSKTADSQDIANKGITQGLDKDYLDASDPRIIAHTKMLGPGESDTITIPASKLPPTEDYTYFCTFPGHFILMKGTIKFAD